jgi:hypothetical protein
MGQVTNFYSKSTGHLELPSTWGTNTDGSGTSPGNFTDSNQVFNVRNNPTPTIGANWTVSGAHSKVVVDVGVTFATGSHTFSAPSVTNINGAFQIDQGGGATGSNFTYGSSGTLIFNTTSGWYGVGSTAVFWPSTNGPVNVTVNGTGGNLEMQTTRTVTGLFQTGGGVRNTGAGNDLIVSGTLQINANGYFTGFSPTYTNTATLVYSTHGQYNHGNEWGGGAYVGYGVPQNVTIQNHTRLNMQAGYWALPGNLLLTGAGDTLASFPTSTDIYIGGNWTRNDSATYLPLGGGIFFQGITNQIITAPGGQTFDYIGINNYGANVVLACNVTVTTMIFFTNGHIVTGSDTLTLSPGGQTTLGNAFLIGNFRKYLGTGATSATFEVGDLTGYRPITIVFGNVTKGGNVVATVSQSSGDHPNIATSGINPARSANRYWTMKNEGVLFDTYSATFNFLSGDLDNGANANKFVVRKFNSPTWSATTSGIRTGTSTQATGLTSFSDFAIGEQQIDHYAVSAVSPQTAGTTFNTTVTGQDILNQTVSLDSSTVVTMSGTGKVQFDSNGDAILGDNTKTLTAGTFTISTKDSTAETINITATDGNGKNGTISGVVINPGPANKLVFHIQPATTAAGSAVAPAVTVQIQDAVGNVVTSDTRNVTLSIGSNPGGGSLSGTTTVAAGSGVATFSNLSINKTGNGYTLLAVSNPALTGATSNTFNITPGAANQLIFGQQPTNTVSGSSISPGITVQIEDANGNIVTGDTRNVTMVIGTNPGGGTLSGTSIVSAVSGVATFSDLSIDKTGQGFTLSTTSNPALPGAISNTFDIVPGPLHHFAIATINSPQVATTPFNITIIAQDINNNTITGFNGSVSLSANIGTIVPAISGAFSSGLRTESVTLTQAGTGRTLSANDGSGHTATSNTFTLNKATTTGTLTTTPNPSTFEQSITLNDSVVSGTVPNGGKVYFKVDGVIIDSATINGSGVATVSNAAMTAGTHAVVGYYGGTDSYDTSTSNIVSQVVNQTTPEIMVKSSLNPSTFGQNITFTIHVDNSNHTPTGSVTFFDGSTSLGSVALIGDSAQLTISSLSAGSHIMKMVYGGDTNFKSDSTTLTQVVNQAIPVVTLQSSVNPSTFGQNITFTVHVDSTGHTPTGSVTFYDGAISLGTVTLTGDSAQVNKSNLSAASHIIKTVYSGDINFKSDSMAITQVVNQAGPIVTLKASLNPSTFGQNLIFTSHVDYPGQTPTGSVTFYDGTTSLGIVALTGDSAQASESNLTASSHTIKAVYSGDGNFKSDSTTISQVVNQADPIVTLKSSLNPSAFGQNIAFTIHVDYAGQTPTGSVKFYDGATSLGTVALTDDSAQVSTITLTSASHTIKAVYGGDGNFRSDSMSLIQVINQMSTNSILSVPSSSIFTGETVTFKDSVVGAFADSGLVQFREGDTTLGTPVGLDANSCASLTIANLSPGNHQVYAVYLGTINFSPSTSNLVDVLVKDSSRYRSFDPDSIAQAVDNKGTMGVPVKRKNTRILFTALITNTTKGVNGLHVEFSAGIDTLLQFYTIPTSSRMLLDSKFMKWNFLFPGPVESGSVVRIYGFGKTGTPQKIPKYYWMTGDAKTGGVLRNPTFAANQPRVSMPNRINVLTETYRFNGYSTTGGLLVGENRKTPVDSSRQYGWLLAVNSTDAYNSLHDRTGTQIGYARGFDIFTSSKTPLIRQQKSMPPKKENNLLVSDMIALKMNIVASELGITPGGFGELLFRDTVGNPLNNMIVKDIAHFVDSVMMGYYSGGVHRFVDTSVFRKLHETVRRIDDAFEGKIDTIKFADTLRMPGTVRLGDVAFLHSNPGVIPERIAPSMNPFVDVPSVYALYQNYPNPFNPTTTIGFDLQYPSIVTLKIFNVLGQEIATLINQASYDEGKQEVQFNGSRYSSGIYFYRIVAHPVTGADEGIIIKDFTLVKKMIMLK